MSLSVGQIFEYALSHMSEHTTGNVLPVVWTENRFNWLNTVKDIITSYGGWRFLEGWGQLTVNNAGIGYFPDHVWEVLSLYPSALGYRRPVRPLGGLQFDRAGPATAAGLSDYVMRWGRYGVSADNDVTGLITATSAAAAADNGMVLTIEGLDANRNNLTEDITLAGVGTIATTNQFLGQVDGVRNVRIHQSTLAGLTQGVVTITSAAGTVLERLDSAVELYHEHVRAELYPTATGPAYIYRFYRRMPDYTDVDQVIHPMPREFKDVYLWGLLWLLHDKTMGAGAGNIYEARMHTRLKALHWYEEKQPGRKRAFKPSRTYRSRANF